MAPKGKVSESGGTYSVTESGIRFEHQPSPPTPKDGEEFLERFSKGFKLNILERPSPDELVFEISGVDVSFANALRRIMIAEVPTIAIEHVFMWMNTSIVHDEVLSHRLGLVPIMCDPRLLVDHLGEDDDTNDMNTIVFDLNVSCGRSKAADEKKERQRKMAENANSRQHTNDDVDDSAMGQTELDEVARDSADLYQSTNTNAKEIAKAIETPGRPYTKHVYSSDLMWSPQGEQEDRFLEGIRPVHQDILLAKLRPGQAIRLEAHARRGIGKDHAKFSPVATAAYRLMPQVELVKPVYDDLAEKLVNLYEPGVFKLVDCSADEAPHKVKAEVLNPYACTMSRNFMRDPILKESVKITRIPNHFIFSIESVGMLKPGVILAEALRVLQTKCRNLMRLLDERLEVEGLNE